MVVLLLALQSVWIETDGGSVLRAEWTDMTVRIAGEAVPVAGIDAFVPGIHYGEDTRRRIRSWIRDLRDDDLEVRERASRRLVEYGRVARKEIEQAAGSPNSEVAWRARDVLAAVDDGKASRPAPRPDRVQAGSRVFEGRLSETTLSFGFRGAELNLPVTRIRGISRSRPGGFPEAPARRRRLEPGDFGKGARVLDFDTAPDGRKVAVGDDVEELYAAWGVVLDSELEKGTVVADGYTVAGASRGLSAANDDPRWTAHVVFTLFVPGTVRGRKGVPSGAHRVGVYVAAVSPRGTGLKAYGMDGRLLQEIWTKGSGTEFLGVECEEPVHRVEIVDDPAIDNNFTTDDFTFEGVVAAPAPPDAWLVRRTDGQRWVAREVTLSGERLAGRSAFGRFEVPVAEVKSLWLPSAGYAPGEDRHDGGEGPHTLQVTGGTARGRVVRIEGGNIVLEDRSIPASSVIRVDFR